MRSIIVVIKSFVSGGDMRWSKMSIHRTMLIYHVLVSLLALVSVGYLWISSERLRFVEEERSLRAAYLEEKKGLLKLEVDQAVGFIRHMQSQTEKRLKENIKNRVYEAHAIAENIYKQHKNSKSTEEIKKIIDLLSGDLGKRLKDRRIKLKINDSAREFIAEAGYDPVYGARPLKRYLQHELETRIGRALLSGFIPDGSTIIVDVRNGELMVTHAVEEEAVVY